MDCELKNLTRKYWQEHETECREMLKSETVWDSIPNLSLLPNTELKDGIFVKYEGMIQDMLNPVFYLDKYEIVNRNTKTTRIECGRYTDSLHCEEHEEFLIDSKNNVNEERRGLYCISIPGLNGWAKPSSSQSSSSNPCSSQPHGESLKRPQESDSEQPNKRRHVAMDAEMSSGTSGDERERRLLSKSNQVTDLNLPIPDSSASACLVTIYKDLDSFLVNQVIQVVGFLSIDPTLSSHNVSDAELMDQDFVPPCSLVPRLHATVVRRVPHSNPLIDHQSFSGLSQDELLSTRKDLKMLLTQLLMGDDLAADYFICYLLSKVYCRDETGTSLGKFSLNISCCNLSKTCPEYGKLLNEILALLVCKSHYFELNVKSLNETVMIPKKDYNTNRLKSGLLQLSDNTYFLVDEINLQVGQLNNQGCLNVKALSSVLTHQRMSYDFQFYDGSFPTDIPMLTISETKSMLPCDCHIKLKVDPSCSSVIRETFTAALQYLKLELLNKIRTYITWLQNRAFDIPETLFQTVQNDFVQMRKENKKTDASDLHTSIVLSRLMCLSYGEVKLTEEMWKQALRMEKERKSR